MDLLNDRVHLAGSGISVPKLIFGSSALGNLYSVLETSTKRKIVEEWFRWVAPSVCIDSAGKYGAGLALEVIGDALRQQAITPEQVTISNKLGWMRVPLLEAEPTFEPGVWKGLSNDAVQRISYEGIVECWKQGNQLLGPPYTAKLLSVHDPDEYLANARSHRDRSSRWKDLVGAYAALEDLKSDGHAEAIGVGAKNWRVIRDLLERIEVDWVMLADSLTLYDHPVELIGFVEELSSRGILVINSAIFNSGFLVGGSYFAYKQVTRREHPRLFAWRDEFYDVCDTFEVSAVDACVEFALAPKGVSAIAMNTSKPGRVEKNVASIRKHAPVEFWRELLRKELVSITPERLR